MTDSAILVDTSSPVPPNEQIFEQLRASIQREALAGGALLPTVRQLAEDLGVAPNTVARAYLALAEQGWIESDRRRGSRVVDRIPSATRGTRARLLREALAACIRVLRSRGYTQPEIASEFTRCIGS